MRIFRWILAFNLAILATACGDTHTPDAATSLSPHPTKTEAQPQTALPGATITEPSSPANDFEQEAGRDMLRLLQLIRNKDPEGLLALLNETRFYADRQLERQDAAKMIEGFAYNMDLPTLTAVLHDVSNEHRTATFSLRDKDHPSLMEENSPSAELFMVYLVYEPESGRPVFHHPYIRYFPYAGKMANRYLSLIRKGKAAELAAFLNPDDADVPDWVAKKTIDAYRKSFDVPSLKVRYNREFSYIFEDKHGKSHRIGIVYGDGLMGISDNFIPAF